MSTCLIVVLLGLPALGALILALLFAFWDQDPTYLCLIAALMTPACTALILSGIRQNSRTGGTSGTARAKMIIGFLVLLSLACLSTLGVQLYQSTCETRIGPRAFLTHCNLEGKDLSGRDLQGANLKHAGLKNAILRDANLSGANLIGADLRGADLTGAALEGATLWESDLEGVIGLSHEQLAAALDVAPEQLAYTLSKFEIRLGSRDTMLAALKNVCSGASVEDAAPYRDDGTFHPLVLLDHRGDVGDWTGYNLDTGWEAMGLELVQLVGCVEDREESIQTCSYTGGPPITRYQHRITITLYSAYDGRRLVQETLEGSTPGSCPQSAPKDQTEIKGGQISRAEVEAWLADYVDAPTP